ncbi:MAG: polysulfide reductase NrfD, partial [Sulfolobales archaeon]|nr:polysulfide reductase NrfD [Sulfolobales archaeon]
MFALWSVAFVVGAIAVYEELTSPVDLTNMTSYVVWGLYVPTYMYFIGASGGVFLISVLVNVLGMKKLEPTVKLSLYSALVLFIMAIFMITLDLGHPERAIEVLYQPQFHSVLEDVVMVYVIYFVLLVVELLLSFRFDLIEGRLDSLGGSARIKKLISRLLQPSASSPESLERSARLIRRSFLYLGAFGLIIALLFIAGEGALVGTVYYSEPWWTGPLFPILYIAGALYSGAALFIVILMALWPRKDEEFREMIAYLGRIVYWLLIGNAVLIVADLVVPIWYGTDPAGMAITNEVLFGQYWYVFWIFEVLLGFIVPGILLSNRFRDRPVIVGIGAAFAGIFYLAVRLVEVIPAFTVPEIPGLQSAYIDPKLIYTYTPNIHEWEVVMFMVAFGIGLLYLGYRILPLVPRAAAP